MKANELMIGDWVLTLDSTHKEKVFAQVDAIEEGKHSILVTKECSNWFVDIDWIEPIPLTPEILEKNGFVKVENTLTSTIIYSFRDSLFRIGVFDFSHITMDSYYTDSSCDIFISSVHQLQHALRLCGIEKEIIL